MILSEGDWLMWLPLAEFWFNSNYHIAARLTPFECLYGYPPPVHLPYIVGMSTSSDVNQLLEDREINLEMLKYNLQITQYKMKKYVDTKRKDNEFDIGDLVLLKVRPYKQHTLADKAGYKLSPIYYGPYAIKDKISSVAYSLKLLEGSAVHSTFHVCLLKKYQGNGGVSSEPVPNISGQVGKIPVAILDRALVKRGDRAATQVKVQWSEETAEQATWEFLDYLLVKFPRAKELLKVRTPRGQGVFEGEGDVVSENIHKRELKRGDRVELELEKSSCLVASDVSEGEEKRKAGWEGGKQLSNI